MHTDGRKQRRHCHCYRGGYGTFAVDNVDDLSSERKDNDDIPGTAALAVAPVDIPMVDDVGGADALREQKT
jgi:hypothetical protein